MAQLVSQDFYTAVQTAYEQAPSGAVNSNLLQSELETIQQKAQSVLGYANYITAVRQSISGTAPASAALNREVVRQAKTTLQDVRDLGGALLRLTRQNRQAGDWDAVHAGLEAGLKTVGQVRLPDIWSDLIANQSVQQFFQEAGVSAAMTGQITQYFQSDDTFLSLQQNGITVSTRDVNGVYRETSLTAPKNQSTQTFGDLLRRGSFDAAVDLYNAPGPSRLTIVRTSQSIPLELPELVLIGVVAATERMADHARVLEDSGLSGNSGSANWVLGLFILAFVIAVGYAGAKQCKKDPSSNWCPLSAVLLFVAALAIWILAAGAFNLGGPLGYGLGTVLVGAGIWVFSQIYVPGGGGPNDYGTDGG